MYVLNLGILQIFEQAPGTLLIKGILRKEHINFSGNYLNHHFLSVPNIYIYEECLKLYNVYTSLYISIHQHFFANFVFVGGL